MALLAVILLLPTIWAALHLILRSRSLRMPFVISHRGAAGLAPENTLAAVRAGLRLKPEFVEIDVQRTADGQLVVLHDNRVDRTTDGTGWIGALTWRDVQKLDAGAAFGAEFAGERIPSLREVLELMAGQPAALMMEIKDPVLYPGIEDQLATELGPFRGRLKIMVGSFDPSALARLHARAPKLPLIQITEWSAVLQDIPQTRMASLNWPSVLLYPGFVRRIHGKGYLAAVWTVDQAWLMRILLWLGVDGITTNRPDIWDSLWNRS